MSNWPPDLIQLIVGDVTALERMAAAAARARAATDRDVLWAGQASRRATGGRSAIGTVIRSSRNGLVSTRGSTATLRPRAIRCISSLMLFIAPGSAGFRCRFSPARSATCRLARCLGQQCFGVQPAQLVGRRVQQRGIRLPVAQHAGRAGPEDHLDRQYLWLAFVCGEDGREQARVAAGLHGQDQARVAGAGPLRAQRRGGHRLQRDACLTGEYPAGLGQRDRAAGPLEQGDAQPAFQLPDRLGQCGLRDAQPGRGAAEVKLVGNRQEVREFPSFEPVHSSRLSVAARTVLDAPRTPVMS